MAGCRWCGKQVSKPRRTFCSEACVVEWRVRSSRSYMREFLWQRDSGVCAECGLNTSDFEAVRKRSEALNIPIPKHRKTFWDCHHEINVEDGGKRWGGDVLSTYCYFCHFMETASRNAATQTEWQELNEIDDNQ